jgi:hypothetical protein
MFENVILKIQQDQIFRHLIFQKAVHESCNDLELYQQYFDELDKISQMIF